MTAITLAELRQNCRDDGDYNNSAVITNTLLTRWINLAIGRYCDLLDKTHEGWRDTTGTRSTVNGTATVTLPDDFLKAKAIDILIDGKPAPLRRFGGREHYGYRYQSGRPVGYRIRGNLLVLYPTPDAVYTISFEYVPARPRLVNDADSIDIPNGWESFITESALWFADKKEERSLADREASIKYETDRIKESAEDRNDAEPEYIPFPGGGTEWWP